MLYAIALYWLAGVVTGSIFKVQILLVLVGVILVESLVLAFAHGSIAVAWAFASLSAVEVGYLAGMYSRRVLEQTGYSTRSARTRRLR